MRVDEARHQGQPPEVDDARAPRQPPPERGELADLPDAPALDEHAPVAQVGAGPHVEHARRPDEQHLTRTLREGGGAEREADEGGEENSTQHQQLG